LRRKSISLPFPLTEKKYISPFLLAEKKYNHPDFKYPKSSHFRQTNDDHGLSAFSNHLSEDNSC
jgi:hypothetical protein